ncbi:class I SAM-dependent methyltransferase [Candidatus Nomurabacteria bacterium]|nr:class I SAM-dependent methyltransferase [Candidatus Nomurabacteria bacterium]
MPKSKNKTKEYYEKNSEIWTEKKTNSFHHEKAFTVFSSLLKDRALVIDIGCSWGIHVPLFLGIGRKLRYEGMDIAKAFLKIARRRYPQLTFYQGDISRAKTLPNKKYDGFWAGAVLMHVPLEDWGQMFKNIEKITKKGAIGYFSLPVEHPSGDNLNTDPRHFTLLTEKEQIQIIKNQGWTIIKKGTMDGFTKSGIWKWYIVRLP